MTGFSCVSLCRRGWAAGLAALLILAAPGAAQAPAMPPDAGQWGPDRQTPDEPSMQDRILDESRRAREDPLRAHGDDRQKTILEGIAKLKRPASAEDGATASPEAVKAADEPRTATGGKSPPVASPPPEQPIAAAAEPGNAAATENPAGAAVNEEVAGHRAVPAREAANEPSSPDHVIRMVALVALGIVPVVGTVVGLVLARRTAERGERSTQHGDDDDDGEGDDDGDGGDGHDDDDGIAGQGYGVPVDSHAPWHHCQGHRLGIVVGPRGDRSLQGALDWLFSSSNVQHRLHIDAGSVKTSPPDIREVSAAADARGNLVAYNGPPPAKGKKAKPVPPEQRLDKFFEAECACCCHWDEVILVAHGDQQYLWHWLLNNLPKLLNDRPVRKMVLWVCGTAAEFFPDHPIDVQGLDAKGHLESYGKQPVFEQIAYLLRPKSCHVETRCGCDAINCESYDADGHRGGQCPDGKDKVTLICGAWYGDSIDEDHDPPKAVPITAKLGIDRTVDPKTGRSSWTLTSPDGNVRTVHIDPAPAGGDEGQDGAAVTTDPPSNPGDVFGGVPLEPEAGLKKGEPSNLDKIKTKIRVAPTTTGKPSKEVPVQYSGGRRCNHPEREGCQQGTI